MTIAPARPGVSDLEIRALFEEARRRRRRRRVTAVLVVAVVTALVMALWVSSSRSPSGRGSVTSSPRPQGTGTFGHRTGDVLVFAFGLIVDLDHRKVIDRTIAGQRPGDQRWAIVRTGDSFVVGWGKVWATPIGGGARTLLGPVVTYVPAARAGAVWLVNYPGGRIGEGTPTLSEVTVGGTVLHSELGPPPSSGVPRVGIPGGLAFETNSGIALWSTGQHRFVRRLGTEAGHIGNAADGLVSWCQGSCASLHVTAVKGADRTVASARPGQAFDPDAMRLSPDGRYVAAVLAPTGVPIPRRRGTLEVIDVRTGHVEVAQRDVAAWSSLTWNDPSTQLFFASTDSSGTTVGEFAVGSAHAETAHLPVRDAEQFVIVKRSGAKALLGGTEHGPSAACPDMGVIFPSRICSYSY